MDANVAVVNNQTTVSFYDDSLTAIIDANGEIWTVMNEVLRNIGFDEVKVENQRKAWAKDIVIERWSKKIPLLFQNTIRETYCINRRGIPIALAKIALTPTMQKTQPELVEKLIRYQVECADVLYQHFYPREICKNTNTPLTREEMAMYMAAIQAQANTHTEEVKNMCTGAFTAVCKVVQKQAEENSRCLSLIADMTSKFYSSYSLNTNKLISSLSSLSSINNLLPKENYEEMFLKEARNLLDKICKAYNVNLKTAFTLVYGKMLEVDGINPYSCKTESSVIKSIAKSEGCRKSFKKCASLLLAEKEVVDGNPLDKNNISVKKYAKAPGNGNRRALWYTPKEIKELITEYQKKTNKKTYTYAATCLFRLVENKIGISHEEMSKKCEEYAKSMGYNVCSIANYLFHNKDLFKVINSIVEEA